MSESFQNGESIENLRVDLSKASQKIASVPYARKKSFDFYTDKMVFDSKEVFYKNLAGYGHILTHSSQSIEHIIPVSNKTFFLFNFLAGDKKPIKFKKSASSPFAIYSKKQETVHKIFIELAKCIDAIVAPYMLSVLWDRLQRGEEITIGRLTISNQQVKKKKFFGGEKVLEQYQQTIVGKGFVNVITKDGKSFYFLKLSAINAPLLKPILDRLYSGNNK